MRALSAGVLASALAVACYDPGLATAPLARDGRTFDAAPGAGPCPDRYVAEAGSCYRVEPQAQTWIVAEADCEDDVVEADPRPHLVVIEDEAENERVRQALPADRWLGLWRESTTWGWITDAPLEFTSWEGGVPASEGHCGEMKIDGLWSDDDCTADAKSYVCEHDGLSALRGP